jgi:hypothetical protein
MDPDACLREQQSIAARLLAEFDAADPETGDWQPDRDDVYRLAELSEGLHDWMSTGGAPPRAWQPRERPGRS